MKSKIKRTAKIALKEINIINFTLEDNKITKQKFNFNNIGYGIGLARKISLKRNLYYNKVKIDFLYRKSLKDKDPLIFGNLTTEYIFKVLNLRSMIKRDNNKIGVPQDLINMFNNVSISTSRGILYCKLLNTSLKKMLLPIINPFSFKKRGKFL